MRTKDCVQDVTNLLKEDKLNEAFARLDTYFSIIKYNDPRLMDSYVLVSAQFYRLENRFLLGTLSWRDYDTSASEVIVKMLNLTRLICEYLFENNSSSIGSISVGGENDANSLKKEREVELILEATKVLVEEISNLD